MKTRALLREPQYLPPKGMQCEVCLHKRKLLVSLVLSTAELARYGRPEGVRVMVCGKCANEYSVFAETAYRVHDVFKRRTSHVLHDAATRAIDEAMNG